MVVTSDKQSLTTPRAVDVLILGGGPAGLSTAITLNKSGYSVLILAREEGDGDKIGESLSPSANTILKQLGVWDTFNEDGHLPCYGNKSSWGASDLAFYDFINDPNGHAWHIDRRLFEQRLVERAATLGVHQMISPMLSIVSVSHDQWRLDLDKGARTLTARFIVDATGRVSWFARRHGAKRLHEDRQIALIGFLNTSGTALADSTSLIEAVQDGWWYSARLPDGRLATAFMSDADLHDQRWVSSEKGWDRLLSQTRYTAGRVRDYGYHLGAKPRMVAAGSSRLDSLWGEGWLAVGDAAMSYDPLSAHGLTLAMVGGRDGAEAIVRYLDGDHSALDTYGSQMNDAYADYAMMRKEYYRAETRWPDSPYWLRRANAHPDL